MQTEGEDEGAPEHVADVVEEAIEDAHEEGVAEGQREAEHVIAGASAAVDAAHETAEQIAAAAMHTELGRRLATQEQELATWRDHANQLTTRVEEQASQITGLQATLQSLIPPPPSVTDPVPEAVVEELPTPSPAPNEDAPPVAKTRRQNRVIL